MTKLLGSRYLETSLIWSVTVSKVFPLVLCGRFRVFIFVSSPSLLVVCMPISSSEKQAYCVSFIKGQDLKWKVVC